MSLNLLRITVPTPGLVAADFYVSSNAEMTALMAAEGVAGLSGKTIGIMPGTYTWDPSFWNSRLYTAETTFRAAVESDRPLFLCGVNYGVDLRSPTNLTLRKLRFRAVWNYGINTEANAGGSGIRIKNNIDGFRVKDCEFYSDLLQIVQDHGFPDNMALVTFKGLLGTDGTTTVLPGGYYITDSSFHGSWRLLQLPGPASGNGPVEVIGCTFYDQGVDSLFISGRQTAIKINWNHFYGPLSGWNGQDIAVTCDPALNRFTSAAPHGLTGTVTVNLSPNMFDNTLPGYSPGTAPSGIGQTTDFTVTRIDDSTLQINGVDPTTAGSNVRIYREPAHADFIQSGTGGNADWLSFEIIGNTVTVERPDDIVSKRSCQVLFMEDINNDDNDLYHYRNGVIAGNLIHTERINHGISLYNPYDCLIANNVVVGYDAKNNGSPPISISLQKPSGTAVGNKIAGNIAVTTSGPAGTVVTGNVNKSLAAGNIDDELVETVLVPVTRAEMIAYYTIKPGSAADLQTPKAGGPGSGHIDYVARTWVSPW